MKTEKKQYRLKKWYPSLDNELKKGDVIEWDDNNNKYLIIKQIVKYIHIDKHEVENNPDFWELIEEKKPLFVTDDGVGVYDIDSLVFAVKGDFLKIQLFALAFSQKKNDMKSFYHEANADEYIWKNKPVFSYEDFRRWGNVPYDRVIMKLAKERTSKK